ITQQHATTSGFNLGLGLFDEFEHAVESVERNFLANLHVGDELRKTSPAVGEFAQRFTAGFHDAQHLQRSHKTIAGRAVITENQMATLFAAEVEAAAQHFIN